MTIDEVKRKDGENECQTLWRLGNDKEVGVLDATWEEIAEFMNYEFRSDVMEYYSESRYRKQYQIAKEFYNAHVFGDTNDGRYLTEKKEELEKERVKVRDERNELRRIIREEARKESYLEQVKRSIEEYQSDPLPPEKNTDVDRSYNNNDLIISFTDIHTGIEIDNMFNRFDEEVLKNRMRVYRDRIIRIQRRHGSENAYVILSELVSGIIHPTLRIENNQDMIQQFLTITDYLSQFLATLSEHFRTVNVYMCPGNHSRISPKPEDSLKGENIDHLAIPFLTAKLQNYKNIKFHENDTDESIAMFDVRGNLVMASHGDKDSPESVVQKFTLMFGVKPKLVYLGHRHTNGYRTVYNTKVIQSGCMSGTDNYALDKRLVDFPSQTVSVITDKGLECLYDITFRRDDERYGFTSY